MWKWVQQKDMQKYKAASRKKQTSQKKLIVQKKQTPQKKLTVQKKQPLLKKLTPQKKQLLRKKHKNNCWENLQGFRYAHRGLFHEPRSVSRKVLIPEMAPLWREDIARWRAEGKPIIPENSMRAFRLAVRYGFGSELDVHLTADGKLVVFHDTTLVRMVGLNRRIEDMTWDELKRIRLLGTDCHIPLLEDVLDLYTSPRALTNRLDVRSMGMGAVAGDRVSLKEKPSEKMRIAPEAGCGDQEDRLHQEKSSEKSSEKMRKGWESGCETLTEGLQKSTGEDRLYLPLIIELKAEGNAAELCAHVMEVVDRYPSLNYCIESFDPRVVYWFRRKRPDVIRGQLTENFMKSREAVRQWGYLMTFGMWSVAPDLLSRPDFIASKYPDRKNIFIRLSHRMGVHQVNWIIKTREELEIVEREGGLGIFERFVPELHPGE